jgi:hypothetical protein
MFALQLIRLIEDHADKLAKGLIRKLRDSEACYDLLDAVPEPELQQRAHEIYHNVADWLLNKSDSEIEERFTGVGARRARQGVPYSQMLYALLATKEHLWEFMRDEALIEPTELIGELDLLYTLDRFFDRAAYFSSVGYESERESELMHVLSRRTAAG